MPRTEDSDLRTFKSSLKQEAQPDFTLSIGNFSWTVHTAKLQKSTFFQKLCDPVGASPRSVILYDDEPILIGNLILWLYTGHYTDVNTDGEDDDSALSKGIDINVIMRNGKTNGGNSNPAGSPELGSAGATSPFNLETEEETWPTPSTLHAKMYVLAEKYGIGELAVLTIDELSNDLSWNSESLFLPSLEYLFTSQYCSSSGDSTSKTSSDEAPNAVTPPAKDSEMFQLLVSTASTPPAIHTYLANATFQNVLRENPTFTVEVLARVASELQETKTELTKVTESIETPKPKKGRKKRVASTGLEKEGG
ncbi:uncharacterized protein A1O9_10075 [Exophiala aquamarina CBS 119918]|uniref:BTB domain-containing protein n=1 Tax=Exophiala aquamarina CBS 119918 TaxID=1182545 RepID=A0A072PDN2_9EURO|nr:uncharacterized protein A1O9_10075 [Exophiala aquamarina CBS 119918]KEF53675.1 hypothetical protein A1O9_10075 [Exophiala aquamarina CBS 119918]